jgi:hypothetical protein
MQLSRLHFRFSQVIKRLCVVKTVLYAPTQLGLCRRVSPSMNVPF